ncbi:pyruvate kinase-like [Drosophila novamexicana]|uniref:pyruvate kinase-like n=1 Tax=Drosophila novamexicana TaxID=47314 RepID=UPI0011E5ACDF|nr:pyruvate kinase-like [Drosophila novamexicana]
MISCQRHARYLVFKNAFGRHITLMRATRLMAHIYVRNMSEKTQPVVQKAKSQLEHSCLIEYNAPTNTRRLSTIICTIGPASRSVEMLMKLLEAGMNLARLNFSHGSHEYHAETVANLRQAVECHSQNLGYQFHLGIALDTKGPEIRIGLIGGNASATVELEKGATFILSTNKKFQENGTQERVYVDYANITKVLKAGHRVFLDDGQISLVVKEVRGEELVCKVQNGGKLGSRKGVNLPGANVDLPAVSEKDKTDLKFAIDQNLDIIFASFIRNANGIKEIRSVLGERGKSIKIIAKIENHEGMQNIKDIIEESDGVMVARGDLGIEIPAEKVFLAQKTIFAQCNRAGKPGICATQMLESMIRKPRATRAELSDVANAVLDGADCVMLSGETAMGDYPVECVQTMSKVCREAEASIWYENLFTELVQSATNQLEQVVLIAAVSAAIRAKAKAIIVLTSLGFSSFSLSHYRPPCLIISIISGDNRIARQSNLYRGIWPLSYKEDSTHASKSKKTIDDRVDHGVKLAKSVGIIKKDDAVVIVTSIKFGSGFTNSMRIIIVS